MIQISPAPRIRISRVRTRLKYKYESYGLIRIRRDPEFFKPMPENSGSGSGQFCGVYQRPEEGDGDRKYIDIN